MANVVEIVLQGRDQASKIVSNVSGSVDALKKAAKIATVAIGATATALFAVAASTAKAGDEIQKMSLRTGVSEEALSQLGFAAEQSGSSLGAIDKGLTKLNKNIADASDGLLISVDAFEKLDVAWQNTDGSLRSAEDLLPEISDALNKLESQADKTQVMMNLFGRSGIELGPLLKEGAKGIEALREEADELGRTFDKVAAEQAAEFVDSQNRLKSSITGVKNVIGEDLIPAFSEVMDKLAEWIARNRELIGSMTDIFSIFTEQGKIELRLGEIATRRLDLLKEQEVLQNSISQNTVSQTGLNKALAKNLEEQLELMIEQGVIFDEINAKTAQQREDREAAAEAEAALLATEAERLALLAAEEEKRKEIEEQLERALEIAEEMRDEERELQQLRGETADVTLEASLVQFDIEKVQNAERLAAIGAQRMKFFELGQAISSEIGDTLTDSIVRFGTKGDQVADAFFFKMKSRLTELALHKFFSILGGLLSGGGSTGLGFIGRLFGQQGLTARQYQTGGIVGGRGSGDIIPALLEPGELVIPKRMSEFLLSQRSQSQGMGVVLLDGRTLTRASGRLAIARIVRPSLNEFDRSKG